MRLGVLAAVLAAALAGGAAAKPAEGPSAVFAPMDLFGLARASDPQVRPDGGAVVYVRVANDIMTDKTRRSLWLVDARTGAQTPLAAGETSASSPRWSPDGTRIAYVASGAGGARAQLHVLWLATGQSAALTDLPQAPDSLAWSPDGETIAFTMFVPDEGESFGAPLTAPEGAKWADPLKVVTRLHYREDGEGYLKPGYAHVFLVSADGGSPRQLTFGPYDDQGPLTFTPDGKAILFSANRSKDAESEPSNTEVFRLSLADGALTALTHRFGPDDEPIASPNGKLIAYLGFDDDHHNGYDDARLYVMGPDGSGSHAITTDLDRSVDAAAWADDGKSLFIQYTDKAVTKVARVGLNGRTTAVAEGLAGGDLDRPYSGGTFSTAKGVVAFTQGAWDQPPDVAVAEDGKIRRLTRLNNDLMAGKHLAKLEHLDVRSSFDGRPIDAWIATPPDFDPKKTYPLILEIHGGPYDAYGPTFASDDQLYAAAGYVVLFANPRGSSSYGEDFARQIDNAYPGHDYDDLMSAVDAAVAKGFVDKDRLYVTGGSGGGVLTAWIIGKTDRFKAAAVQKPVIDWASFSLTTDAYAYIIKHWFRAYPWQDPDAYWKRSPLSLVGNVKTPAMVVVGEDDMRTPDSEAEQYYQALKLRDVPAALVKVPGASHGGLARRPSQSAAKAAAILAWFHKYGGP